MKLLGVVGFQKGDSSSRGLPASCVITVFGTSAMDIRSAITRYGDSGLSSLVRYGRHFAIHGSFSALMRRFTRGVRPRGLPFRRSCNAACSMVSINFESPSNGYSVGMFLLMSIGSRVLWINTLFLVGKRMPKPVA